MTGECGFDRLYLLEDAFCCGVVLFFTFFCLFIYFIFFSPRLAVVPVPVQLSGVAAQLERLINHVTEQHAYSIPFS